MQIRSPLDTRLLRRSRRGGTAVGGRLPNASQRGRTRALDCNRGTFDFVGHGDQDSNEAGNKLAIKAEDGLKSHFTMLTSERLILILIFDSDKY